MGKEHASRPVDVEGACMVWCWTSDYYSVHMISEADRVFHASCYPVSLVLATGHRDDVERTVSVFELI